MWCADGDEAPHAGTAEFAQIGAGDEPAHAVSDEHHLLRAGVRLDLFDFHGQLDGETFNRRERRAIR